MTMVVMLMLAIMTMRIVLISATEPQEIICRLTVSTLHLIRVVNDIYVGCVYLKA